jgi:hypothetical protein
MGGPVVAQMAVKTFGQTIFSDSLCLPYHALPEGYPGIKTSPVDYWALREDVHDWLAENRMPYVLLFNRDPDQIVISLRDKDLLMFKLRWGGR